MEDAFEQKNRMKALSSLRQTVSGVEIDALLARLLRQAETRVVLQDVLLAQLFEILWAGKRVKFKVQAAFSSPQKQQP